MKPGERLAVIDLGSNSFRLVVFMAGEGWWKRTDEIYEPVRIGEGMAASGELGAEPIARALATLDVFAQFAKASGLTGDSVDAVATSAIRDASNAEAFLGQAREHFDLPIRVLSREQEARYGYLAAVNSTTLDDGFVLDLGGGSLQLVRVLERIARGSGSWRLGTVRMSERFLPPNGPAKRRQLEALREHVAEELAQADWLGGSGEDAPVRRLVGIGGTVRNLAAAAQRAAGLPSNGVQGMVIERDALAELVERLAELPAAERARVPGIKPAQGRHHPGRRSRRSGRAAGRRLRWPGDDRGGAARGRLLRAPADRRIARGGAAVRGRAPGQRAEPRRPVPPRRRAHASRGGAGAGHVRRAGARSACTRAISASASCCGRRASCTTSACRSTTTITTSTRAT